MDKEKLLNTICTNIYGMLDAQDISVAEAYGILEVVKLEIMLQTRAVGAEKVDKEFIKEYVNKTKDMLKELN